MTKKAAYHKAYQQAHKAEIAAKKKAHRQTQKAEDAAYDKAYRLAHKPELAAYKKAYRQAHKAEIAAYKKAHYLTHKAEGAAYGKVYQQANPDKIADKTARRRALKRGVTVEKVSRAVVFERDKGRCHRCGKKVNPKGWHLDHLIPLARGGEHSYSNVAVSHPKCNMSKGIKPSAKLRLF